MKSQVKVEQLTNIGLFKGMSLAQIEHVTRKMRTRVYKKDENIIVEGELGDELFVLLHGNISISKRMTLHNSNGGNQMDKSLIQLRDSDHVFFGEMSLLGSDERSATVRALSDTTLGVLTRLQVKKLAEEDPELGYFLFSNIGSTLAGHLRKANKDILKLTTALCLALESR